MAFCPNQEFLEVHMPYGTAPWKSAALILACVLPLPARAAREALGPSGKPLRTADSRARDNKDQPRPAARLGASGWRGTDGRLWLFGGYGITAHGHPRYLRDLWVFDPARAHWQQETTRPSEVGLAPGDRVGALRWVGHDGTFWLFGGFGREARGVPGPLGDLWAFHPATRRWVHIGGSRTPGAPGTYGPSGPRAVQTMPGARSGGSTWVDRHGRLWLFGGYGISARGHYGRLNDLWRFNPQRRRWTRVSGSFRRNAPGRYRTAGLPGMGPGARSGAMAWTDAQGHLWLFGGYGFGAHGPRGPLNDVWEFFPKTGVWHWQGGSRTPGARLTLTPGRAQPGGLGEAAVWPLGSGQVLMLGGFGEDTRGHPGYLNTIWRYTMRTGRWVLLGGSVARQANCCESRGKRAPAGAPEAVAGATGFPGGRHFWMFGGYGVGPTGRVGYLRRLWKLTAPRSASEPLSATSHPQDR